MLRPIHGVAAAAAFLLAGGIAMAGTPQRAQLAPGASNSAGLATARHIRQTLAAAGFSDIVNLDEDRSEGGEQGGIWSCRAIHFGVAVRVEIDPHGKISIV